MKYICFLLLLSIISCGQQNKTDTSKSKENKSKTIPAAQPVVNTLPNDPMFVDSKDTISMYGPYSITRNMLQDRNGLYWFATWQGIIRYDGISFTNMTLKEGLGHFHVFSILEDRSGNLWFGTIGGGLYRYNPLALLSNATKPFTYFTMADGLASNTIMNMLEDNSGNIWFGTDRGVSCYNGNTFTNFTKKEGLTHDTVYAIVQDNTGILWFGTQGATCCYYPTPSLNTAVKFTKIESHFGNIRAMIKDKTGNLWFGSTSGGLSRYDGKSFAYFTEKDGLTNNYIGCISEDKAGNIWMGGNVMCYNGKSFTPFEVTEGQNSNTIFCIYEDANRNMWFCGINGVYRYDRQSNNTLNPVMAKKRNL
ncbi:MAG: two-component regulator propeller domain-containing protein [Bacteroidota bacterium]